MTNLEQLDRRQLVVLNADVVDYSRLIADDELATVAMMRDYRQLVSDAVATASGTLASFIGDNFMAVFADARSAMQAAVAVALAVKAKNADRPAHRHVRFRMGLDTGAVVMAEDRYFGDPVNIAARVQALAEPGGIMITEAVYVALDEPALRFASMGARQLKNIPGLIRTYRLTGLVEDGDVPTPLAMQPPSIAVLPLIPYSEGKDLEALAGLLTEDLVTALVKRPGLEVIDVAREDSAAERTAPPAARYILEGGLHRSGPRMRVHVQVLETPTMNNVWAERWDIEDDDHFSISDRVTEDVVRAIEIELVVGEPARIYHALLDAEAVERVYHGWYELIRSTPESLDKAQRLFASLAESHPESSVGTALAGFSLWWGASQGMSTDPERDLRRAAAYARRGVELDDPTGLSHMIVAALALGSGDSDAALARADVAIQRRPTCDITFAVGASIRRYLGQWENAVGLCQKAIRLSAMVKPWYPTVLASSYYVGEHYQEAADTASQVLQITPDNLEALLVLAAAQAALGLERRARGTAAVIAAKFPATRRSDLTRLHPFQDPAIIERWADHLARAGLE
jgi:adenylate cyclase